MVRGRPRAFDPDAALDQALDVFWKKGYEGATLPDLTRAMGINRPSLYATFGNKEELFRKAFARYSSGPAGFVQCALDSATAREVAEKLLTGGLERMGDPGRPRGCLAVHGALASGADADPVRRELARHREAGKDAIRVRLERARAEGDLPASADPAALAGFLATMMHGMAVQAAGGASKDELRRIAMIALDAWPD